MAGTSNLNLTATKVQHTSLKNSYKQLQTYIQLNLMKLKSGLYPYSTASGTKLMNNIQLYTISVASKQFLHTHREQFALAPQEEKRSALVSIP